MTLLPRHEYSPIASNEIRLIHLQPGCCEDALHCELQIVTEDNSPPYEALSYCWGKEEQKVDLGIGQAYYSISTPLSRALKLLRYANDTRVLWIDQISINQKDDHEKSVQVLRMGRTYRQASQVLVWLGDEDEETPVVFKLIDNIAQQILEFRKQREVMDAFEKAASQETSHFPLELSPPDAAEWVAFRNFNSRPWFTRVWTFQELVLSQKATLICGTHSTSWQVFSGVCKMVSAFDRTCLPSQDSHFKGSDSHIRYLSITNLFVSGQRYQRATIPGVHHSIDLMNLVQTLRKNSSSQAMDKIYGLLGCANDVDTEIQSFVDYSVTFDKTYTVFAKWFINRYKDLSVLRLVDITSNPSKLPSWVPDFRSHNYMNNLRVELGPRVLPHGIDRLYNATGSTTASVALSYDSQLCLRGVPVGSIATLGDPAGNITNNVAIGRNVLTGGLWSQLAAQNAIDGIYAPTGEPIELAYHRLRIGDYAPGEIGAEHRRSRGTRLSSLPEPSKITYSGALDGLAHAGREDIGSLILKYTTRQRFYVTDTGYMGLAHHSCQVGDRVYLLMGGDMPFILRSKNSGTFHFKGESYVHGIMDGEFLLRDEFQTEYVVLD
jgi:heterokaryon incompatibility protein (HET)